MNGSFSPCAVGWAEVISGLYRVRESKKASFTCLGGHAGRLGSPTTLYVTSLLSVTLRLAELLTWRLSASKSTKWKLLGLFKC